MPTPIREATSDDIDVVVRIHDASRRVAYRRILPRRIPPEHGIAALRRDWNAVLGASGTWTLLLEEKGEPVGFAALGPTREEDDSPRKVCELYATHFKPSVWSQASEGR